MERGTVVFLLDTNIFRQHQIYSRFVEDLVNDAGLSVIGLSPDDIAKLISTSTRFNLDFDDAYQYVVAEKFGFKIVSFDSDFDRTTLGRNIPSEITI